MKGFCACALIALAVALPSCQGSSPEKVNTSPTAPIWGNRVAEEQNVYEAVFRYQFDHNASGRQKAASAYCLSIGERDVDPSDQFIERFAGNKPPVRKASECNVSPAKGVVVDRRSGGPALIFRVTGIVWMSSTIVTVSGGYYEGSLSASGNTYTVEQGSGKWKVTKDEMGWIS